MMLESMSRRRLMTLSGQSILDAVSKQVLPTPPCKNKQTHMG